MADKSSERDSDQPPLIYRDGLTTSGAEGIRFADHGGASSAETAASEPRRIGKFTFIGQVGAGAFGVVWKARDEELGRTVAIKMLHPGVVTAKSDRERFLREARAAAQLRHPGIVPLHEVVDVEGQPAIVSAFVHGVTLRELMDVRSLRPRETAILIADIACALDYAHSLKMVHRDVKPANIMVEFQAGESLATPVDGADQSQTSGGSRASTTRTGSVQAETSVRTSGPRALLLDFGLALRDDVEATLTIEGQIIGTPSYMSPEQAIGDGHRVDRRTDVYSLGAVLFELLTGEPPFKGSKIAAIHQVIHDSPRTPRSIVSSVPRDLETICLKAMSKSRTGRYDTALEMARDLWRWLNDEPILARRPTLTEQLRRWVRRSPAVAGSIAVMAMLLVVVAISASLAAVKFRSLADDNEKARKAADDALAVSQQSLWTMRTAFGLQSANQGSPAQGLPWFAAAAELELDDPEKTFENRLRFGNWMRAGAVPIRTLKLEEGNEPLSLHWHPSGNRLLVQSSRKGMLVWDLNKDELIPMPAAAQRPDDVPMTGAWSPDGEWLAVGSFLGHVDLIRVATWEVTSGWQQNGRITSLEFSGDGSRLASGGATVRVQDIREGKPVGEEIPHPAPLRGIRFDTTGDRIVTSCDDNLARVYRLRPESSAEPLFPPVPHFAAEFSMSRFPAQLIDKDRVLLTLNEAFEVCAWDAVKGDRLPSTNTFAPTLLSLAPDQTYGIAVSFAEGRLLSLPAIKSYGQALKHTNHIYSASYRPDGEALATASGDRTLRVWSSRDGRPLMAPIYHHGDVRSAAWSPDGSHLASAQLDGLIRVWFLERPYRAINVGGQDSFIEMSADGRHVFRGPWQSTGRNPTSSQAFEVESGKPIGNPMEFGAYVNGSFFAPDGIRAVTLASMPISEAVNVDLAAVDTVSLDQHPGQVILWNWQTGLENAPRVTTPSEPIGAAWSPDGASVVVLCAAGDVLLIEAETGRIRGTAHQGERFSPFFVTRTHVRFAQDGKSVITWADRLTKVWNIEDLSLRFAVDISGNSGSQFTHDVTFSRDGRLIAVSGSDKFLRIFDYATGQPAFPPLHHPDWVFTACFSADGSRILTACRDGMARLWDVKTGTLVCPALQHTDEVFGATITPDDRWLITVGRDSTTRFWSARNGKPVTPPITMPGWMYEARVTPDSRFALVSGVSDRLFVFDLKSLLQPYALPQDARELMVLSEVVSGQALQDGGTVNFTTTEWLKRWNEVYGAYPHELQSLPGERPSDLSSQLRRQLSYHVTWGNWTNVAEILRQLIAADSTRFRDYFDLATLEVHLGEFEAYRATCREMQTRFADTAAGSSDRSEQLGKTLLLAPDPGTDLTPIAVMVERAAADTASEHSLSWYVVAGALADYRTGNHSRAKERLNQFFELAGNTRTHLTAMAFALQALTDHHLGQPESAANALQSARTIVTEQLPQPDKGTWFQADWSDWLRCLILVREAEDLLLPSGANPMSVPN